MNAPLLPALPGYDDPQLIAHGTTALVFRAIQTKLNRPVAIKVITMDTDAGAVPVNVERELATTVALSSQPHIVSIIDTGVTADERRYIVMEYCEGGSYGQILRQKGPLPVDDVIEVGIKIGQALHAAHEAGIVHRDVKPSNILRSRFGPALTDFGIARGPDELGGTLTREMMTPHHASPEALLHQAQSGPSDIYSLASTLWALLVGHPPFVDPARPDMDIYTFRDRVLHEALPAMPREDVPDWLVAELRRAMSKLPSQRHGSALEFSEALQRGLLGLPAPEPATRTPVVTRTAPAPASPGVPVQAWPATDLPEALPSRGAVTPVRSASPAPGPTHVAPPARTPPPATPGPPPPVQLPTPPLSAPQPANALTPATPWEAPPAPATPAPEVTALFDHEAIYRPGPATAAPRTAPPRTAPPVPPVSAPAPPAAAAVSPVPRVAPSGQGGQGGQGDWRGLADLPTSAWQQVPVETVPSTLPGPEPARESRFSPRDQAQESPRRPRRTALLAGISGVLVVAALAATLIYLNARPEPQAVPQPGASQTTTAEPTPSIIQPGNVEDAPTDLRIAENGGTWVKLTWTDPTGGLQSYVAVQHGPGENDVTHQQVPAGGAEKSATFFGLDEKADYCFQVVVIVSATDIPATPEVCVVR